MILIEFSLKSKIKQTKDDSSVKFSSIFNKWKNFAAFPHTQKMFSPFFSRQEKLWAIKPVIELLFSLRILSLTLRLQKFWLFWFVFLFFLLFWENFSESLCESDVTFLILNTIWMDDRNNWDETQKTKKSFHNFGICSVCIANSSENLQWWIFPATNWRCLGKLNISIISQSHTHNTSQQTSSKSKKENQAKQNLCFTRSSEINANFHSENH